MCLPSPKPPAPPPPPPKPVAPPIPPAPPPKEVNAAETKLRETAPKAPTIKTSSDSYKTTRKRGKRALRIPLQVGGASTSTGANVPKP